MAEHIVSRTVLLEIRQDRAMIVEGHHFLDEKRVMLAREMLKRLEAYREDIQSWQEARVRAERCLKAAIVRHGLEGLQVHPVPARGFSRAQHAEHPFLGITLLVEVHGLDPAAMEDMALGTASNPSPEAVECGTTFAALMSLALQLAAAHANLMRLRDEYRRTDRRVRALENVILPEIEEEERRVSDLLDESEQEEVIRSHLFAGK